MSFFLHPIDDKPSFNKLLDGLSPRQVDICRLLYLSCSDIAKRISIGRRSTEKHVEILLDRFDCTNRIELGIKLAQAGFQFDRQYFGRANRTD